jgi:predicted naringenin-chalcone synthase
MQRIYALGESDKRKLKFLYQQSGIGARYSVVPDYTRPTADWVFYPPTENLEPFPSIEKRMEWYRQHAAPLSVQAIRRCLEGKLDAQDITHLITVSCTGMSAPGLDLELLECLGLPTTIFRTSVNFMGCYAAVHALKLADALCGSQPGSRVLIVCTELCTLHFQQEPTMDNMMSGLLFSDGSAATLVVSDDQPGKGLRLKTFYSEVGLGGKKDMTWDLSSTGFRMTLTSYIPDLIGADFTALVGNALKKSRMSTDHVSHWCMHPGGKKILDSIHKSLALTSGHLDKSYEVLQEYGNMSSPTILFVLQRIMETLDYNRPNCIFGAAFGPGLTMETFIGETV